MCIIETYVRKSKAQHIRMILCVFPKIFKVQSQKDWQILRKRSADPNGSNERLLEFKPESLILAQNERWRQA